MSEESSFELETEELVEVGKVTGIRMVQAAGMGAAQTQSHTSPSPSHRVKPASSASPKRSPGHKPVEKGPKFYERFRTFLETAERKRQQRREALVQREDAACTFAPKLIAKQAPGRHKSMEEMYEDAVAQAKQLQQRREAAQEQELQTVGPFRPIINSQSQKLAEGKREEKDLFTFLHRTKTSDRPRRSQIPEKPTFTPSINRRSEVIFREKTIEELLMEDAQKRQARKSSMPARSPRSEKLISNRSERVLSDKFAQEFADALQKVSTETILTKPQLYELLRILHFTKGLTDPSVEDLWESLCPENELGIEVKVIHSLLSAILRLQLNDPSSSLSPRAVERIHQSFKPLYDTRQAVVCKSSRNPSFKFHTSYSFRPDTSKSAYFLLTQNTDRTALRSPKVEDYMKEMRRQAAEKGEKTKGEAGEVSKKSLLGQYINLAQGTIKRPQDRNEALYRLAELEQKRRSALQSTSPSR